MRTSDLALLHQWHTRRNARAFHELAVRYTPMVYATCRRVLRDESSAEDVTQECFELLATAKRSPKSQLPAWLHRVATNRSLDALRSADSRAKREREYVELQKGHGEIDWDDIYNHIDEIIDDLPDKTRHAIVATFLENRSQTAVASDLGVSPQAVNKRISRGIETIRTQLRKRGIEVSAATLATLMAEKMVEAAVPAALASTVGKIALASNVSVATAGGSLAGIFTVGNLLVATVITFVVVAGVALYKEAQSLADPEMTTVAETARSAPGVSDNLPAIEDQSPAQVDSRSEGASVAVERRSTDADLLDTSVETQQTHMASLSGRVLLPDGRPFAGAQVSIDRVDIERAVGDDRITTQTNTAEQDGAFAFQDLEPGTYGIQVIPPDVSLSTGKVFEIMQVSLKQGEHKSELRVVYGAEGNYVVAGVVVNTRNQPIEGVDVSSSHGTVTRRAKTNYRGEFVLEHVARGQYTISADHEDYTDKYVQAKAGDSDLLIVMLGKGSFEGRVLDAKSGAPVSDYEVSYMNGHAYQFHDSLFGNGKRFEDQRGAFHFEEVYSGDLTVSARAEGYSPAFVHTHINEHETVSNIVLRLERGTSLMGRVIDSSGNAVVDASIYLGEIPIPDLRDRGVATTTDSEGRFTIRDFPSDLGFVSVWHTKYAAASGPIADETVIVLQEAAQLEFHVTEGGEPLPKAQARVYFRGEVRAGYIAGGNKTGPDGSVVVDDLMPGRVMVSAVHPRDASRSMVEYLQLEPGASASVRFDFSPTAAELVGTVSTPEGLPEYVPATLYVQSDSGLEKHEYRVGADGTFRFTNLPAGTATLRVMANREGNTRISLVHGIELHPGEVLQQDVLLEGDVTVTGHVTGYDGSERVLIHLFQEHLSFDEAVQTAEFMGGALAMVGRVGCDEFGQFVIDHIDPGEYTLLIERRPFNDYQNAEPIAVQTIRVESGSVTEVDLPFR